MEEKKKVFEVRSDFYDDVLGAWAIDCWFDADDNSEGEVVAHVDEDGNVKWENYSYRDDKLVNEEIANLIKSENLGSVVRKNFSNLSVGDRLYILGDDWYRRAHIVSVTDIEEHDGKEFTFECDGDEFAIQLFADDMDSTKAYWFLTDDYGKAEIYGDLMLTTSKKDAIEHFEQVKENVEEIIKKFK